MLDLTTILFPTDDSPAAEAARPVAERFARRHGAALHVLRVEIVPPVGDLRFDAEADTQVTDAGVVEVRRRHPTAGGAILAYADEIGADLVVMGTHGRSGFTNMVMGSTAEFVLRRADCPVLTVGPKAGAPESGPILAPVEFTSDSDAALETAVALAEAEGVPLVAVHVVEPVVMPVPYAVSVSAVDQSGLVDRVRETLQTWMQTRATGPVRASVEVREGDAIGQILDAASAHTAALIVQASHGRTGVARVLLGSIAEAVARRAPCPVLTLRTGVPGLVRDADPEAATTPIPRADWGQLFDVLSRRAAQAPHAVSVAVVSPDASGTVYDRARLLGVTYDERDDAVGVMVEGGQHHVVRPFAIRSTAGAWTLDAARDADAPGPWTLDVIRADGAHERIAIAPISEAVSA
ncbi:MAG: universal stress protein [Bacteroidota bacterium]